MAVTPDDLRHIAGLARVGLDAREVPTLVGQLNAILAHMDVLMSLDHQTTVDDRTVDGGGVGTPLRDDSGPATVLLRRREEFAPSMRDGFFLVPRLATHDESGVVPSPLSES
ncbi:MAG: hypothetical protein NVS1B4_15620 [Gemmatimonadaceae bacterium]